MAEKIEPLDKEFGKLLRLFRRRQNFTLIELAHLLGVSPSTLVRWESGLTAPSQSLLSRFASILDIPIDDLIRRVQTDEDNLLSSRISVDIGSIEERVKAASTKQEDQSDFLRAISFGSYVAEDETESLDQYFIETNTWKDVADDLIDIVYGPKGAGKSAIYISIINRSDLFEKSGIDVIPAENIRGATAFADMITDPPADESQFCGIWKLYFLSLIMRHLDGVKAKNKGIKYIRDSLAKAEILPNEESTLRSIYTTVHDYVKMILNPKEVGAFGVKIVFREPSTKEKKDGFINIDVLLTKANEIYELRRRKAWLVLDRLDVAFDESSELEKSALRGLFRAYKDFSGLSRINLKIFLRTDIWNRISDGGFREATHIVREANLAWDKNGLLHLVLSRILSNSALRNRIKFRREDVLADNLKQEKIFYDLFPAQIDRGVKQSRTLDWIMKRISDSVNPPAPRELLLFLDEAKKQQIRHIEIGRWDSTSTKLIDAPAMKDALPALSEYRVTKHLYAEYPGLKKYVDSLREEKAEHSIESLTHIWGFKDGVKTAEVAEKLSNIGFFERRKSKGKQTYWVPFIFRPFLKLVQGKSL